MKLKKDIRKYIILSGLFFILIISLFALATALIRKPGVQQYLLKKVCIGYGLETKTGEIELNNFGRCGVVIHDIETCLKDKSCGITASSMTIKFSKLRLLKGELIPVSVDIKHPVIKIHATDIISFLNNKDRKEHRAPIICRNGLNGFNIEDGEILITGPSGFVFNNLNLTLEHIKKTSNSFRITGNGTVEHEEEQSEFNIKSNIDVNTDDILKSVFNASLSINNTPVTWIPEHSSQIDIKKGFITGDLNISGSIDKGIDLGGALNLKSIVLTLMHKGRSKRYNIPEVDCIINSSVKNRVIHIDSLNMKNLDLNINVDMMFDLTNLDNPYFRLAAKSEFMS